MKKLFLILVLCLSVVGISGCGASAPKEVKLSPETTKILEVGKDIAPGTYVVEVDNTKTTNEEGLKRHTLYAVLTKDDPRVDRIKTAVANGKNDALIKSSYFNERDLIDLSNDDKLVASDGKVIIVYSAGNTTMKQK